MADSDSTEEFLSSLADAIPEVEDQSSVMKMVDDFLHEQTEGLKAKNTDLITEVKTLKANADGLDGEEIRGMLEQLSGKTLDAYGDGIREESAAQVSELSTKLTESEQRAQTLDGQYQSTLINLELRQAAERARVRPEAISDFVALHGKHFQLVEGRAVAGELSPEAYVSGILDTSGYWLPASRGAGARGSSPGYSGIAGNSDRALLQAASSGDQNEYRKIRSKQRDTG